jgi:hypothetical protein
MGWAFTKATFGFGVRRVRSPEASSSDVTVPLDTIRRRLALIWFKGSEHGAHETTQQVALRCGVVPGTTGGVVSDHKETPPDAPCRRRTALARVSGPSVKRGI